jgi:hypothetical protein
LLPLDTLIVHPMQHRKTYQVLELNSPIILAENIADSMKLKTSLLSEGAEETAAYVKEAMIKELREPASNHDESEAARSYM